MKINVKKSAVMQRFTNSDVSVTRKERVYDGFFQMEKYTLKHKLFSEQQSPEFTREIFERGDAVVVMAYDIEQDSLVLIEQFRPGALRGDDSPWLLEFIAGMFDENESPEEVAIREAKEEANITLSIDNLSPIMKYLSSPGGMSECIYLYLAIFDSRQVNNGAVHGLADENEDILLHLVSRTQALELLAQGKITNAATIIGLQWLAINYQSLKSNTSG
jgi:ADP-ribose pyrophosphatase